MNHVFSVLKPGIFPESRGGLFFQKFDSCGSGDRSLIQERNLPQGGGLVERVKSRYGVRGDKDLVSPQAGGSGRVKDADVGHGPRDHQISDPFLPEKNVEVSPKEGVVGSLGDKIIFRQGF